MDRIHVIREWLLKELERVERAQGPFTSETEYEALLRELLAVINRNTITPSDAQNNEAQHRL